MLQLQFHQFVHSGSRPGTFTPNETARGPPCFLEQAAGATRGSTYVGKLGCFGGDFRLTDKRSLVPSHHKVTQKVGFFGCLQILTESHSSHSNPRQMRSAENILGQGSAGHFMVHPDRLGWARNGSVG